MASEAVIHFFGLVVATTQALVAPQTARVATQVKPIVKNQVVMVMPSITKLNGAAVVPRGAIEPHTAMMIFEAQDLLSSRGFDINRLSPDYLSIELNGDVITFTAEGEERAASIGKQLPGLAGTLLADFRPPAYSGAAAVFKIPYGELTTCTSAASGTMGRIDNELHLKNSGTLSINSGAKSLTLSGDADVYMGNAPMGYVIAHAGEGSQRTVAFKPHYFAYCWMTGKTNDQCTMPMPVAGCCNPCAKNRQRPALGADVAVIKPKPPQIFYLTSFECSNTQWP